MSIALLVVASGCSKDTAGAASAEPNAARPGPVATSPIPSWEDAVPAGALAVAELDLSKAYVAVKANRRLTPATWFSPAGPALATVSFDECAHETIARVVWLWYPSGHLVVLTGDFDSPDAELCAFSFFEATTEPKSCFDAADWTWRAVRDGVVLIASSPDMFEWAQSADTARLGTNSPLGDLLGRAPAPHVVRFASRVPPGDAWPLMTRFANIIESPLDSVVGSIRLGEDAELAAEITFASDRDAAAMSDWYATHGRSVIRVLGRHELDFLFDRVSLRVDHKVVAVRARLAPADINRLLAHALAPGPRPDDRDFSGGIADEDLP